MELKTNITAEEGTQKLVITREFDLPVELLFKAYVDSDIFEQWMGTKVIKLDAKKHGSYQFETSRDGNVVFSANGVIHKCIPNQKITRTFEMDNSQFGVQLEILEFHKLTDNTSKLSIHSIFETVSLRDQMLQLPFAHGLNMAHNRLQEIAINLK